MRSLIFFLLLSCQLAFSQELHLQIIHAQTDASLRGLSVVDDSVAWLSGSKGYIGKTTNGGIKWNFQQLKGFEQCDFRSIYAFNEKTAIIANAGAPAYILYTNDAGNNWVVVYENNDSAAFFDGLDFWNNKEGMIYGDPIHGRMLLLRTNNGGQSWHELSGDERPLLEVGEASFAASGTCIRCIKNNKVIIATGGTISRLWVSDNKGAKWHTITTPILQGQNSTGIFSLACKTEKAMIIVGGDFKSDTLKNKHVFYTNDAGQNWLPPKLPTGGYRESVEYISPDTVIATGPAGTDISYDGGIKWMPLSGEKQFHVMRKARKGKLVIMAGGAGKIGLVRE